MVETPAEMIVAVNRDPVLGPHLVVGTGGTATEVLADVVVAHAGLHPRDIQRLLERLRGYPLLSGYRGAEPYDVPALVRTLSDVAGALHRLPAEVDSLEVNPLVVLPASGGVVAVDVRATVVPTDRAAQAGNDR